MASAPKALEKLDQKRETLHKLKGVLAPKLEKKKRHKEAKKVQSERCASAMLANRRPDSNNLQERSASAMTVLKPASTNSLPTLSGNLKI